LTHPDTYNLVGFSECLHLWWIPLLTPELLTPELCVTSVTMDQFSLTTRLALNEFQASCYSHHRSQSALGETNWLLRVSGCNLTLNHYLVIQMGHYHEHPLPGAMKLRPDHWSATLKLSPRDPQGIMHWHRQNTIIQSNNIHHAKIPSLDQPLKSLPFNFQIQPIPTYHNPSMLIGFQFITISCHFKNDPLT